MLDSPSKSVAEVLSLEILINGIKIKDHFEVMSVDIERAVNKIAVAKVAFILPLGSGDNLTFTISESADFIPGKNIEIKLGSVSDKSTVFKGIIVNHSIRNLGGKSNELVIRCSDEAVKMTLGRKSATYQNMKDSAIINAIAGEYGLSAKVDSTQEEHKQLVKYQTTDWDFIISRAEANGLLTYCEDGTLMVQSPNATGSAVLAVDFSRDVFAFDCGLESRFQPTSVTCTAWDMKTQAIVEGKSTEPTLNGQGNLKPKEMGTKIELPVANFASTAPLTRGELKTWADAQLLKYRMSGIQGSITIFGNAKPKINALIDLDGFGDRFNNHALITSIQHTVRSGQWKTVIGFGLPAEWHYEHQHVSAAPAGGLLPVISGLQNGTVKKIDQDPDGEFRIQVDVPVIAPAGTGIWARLSHFYATTGKGSYFLPEVGDEVILGFMNDDPRYPVILGMLYSSKVKSPYTPDATNKIKAIVTKSDLKIEFNDEDKTLIIQTPGGNSFTLSDKDKAITVKDQNGNKIVMDSGGIELSSAKDVKISATGNITLQATQGISAKASGGDIALSGLNIDAKAQISFAAQGTASAEVKASGITTIKGSMVMIN